MKKLIFLILILLTFVLTPTVSAQMGMGRFLNNSDDDTKKEEVEGRQIWERLQKKEIDCQKLSDDQFEALGEYFMGMSLGKRHPEVNTMMKVMMGKAGERQAHINMGKKFSGCFGENINSFNFIPMMGMIGGFGCPMMGRGGWGLFGWFGFLYWGLVQILVLVILVLLAVYLFKKVKSSK